MERMQNTMHRACFAGRLAPGRPGKPLLNPGGGTSCRSTSPWQCACVYSQGSDLRSSQPRAGLGPASTRHPTTRRQRVITRRQRVITEADVARVADAPTIPPCPWPCAPATNIPFLPVSQDAATARRTVICGWAVSGGLATLRASSEQRPVTRGYGRV